MLFFKENAFGQGSLCVASQEESEEIVPRRSRLPTGRVLIRYMKIVLWAPVAFRPYKYNGFSAPSYHPASRSTKTLL